MGLCISYPRARFAAGLTHTCSSAQSRAPTCSSSTRVSPGSLFRYVIRTARTLDFLCFARLTHIGASYHFSDRKAHFAKPINGRSWTRQLLRCSPAVRSIDSDTIAPLLPFTLTLVIRRLSASHPCSRLTKTLLHIAHHQHRLVGRQHAQHPGRVHFLIIPSVGGESRGIRGRSRSRGSHCGV